MEWEPVAENVLAQLCLMVPETLRDLAGSSARDESEQIANARGAAAVGADDVVRGWIAITPPEQRNSLVAVIESLGFAPEDFADELEHAEGWDDEELDGEDQPL